MSLPAFWHEHGPSESVLLKFKSRKLGEFGADRPIEKSGDGSQEGLGYQRKRVAGAGAWVEDGVQALIQAARTLDLTNARRLISDLGAGSVDSIPSNRRHATNRRRGVLFYSSREQRDSSCIR